MRTAEEVLTFWFIEHGPEDWFGGGEAFDRKLAKAFGATHERIAMGEGFMWRATPRGRVAEIIVLDQFSRQLHRGQAKAFAQDGMALALAQELVAAGLDKGLDKRERQFAYMPYMHSESLLIHREAVALFTALGDAKVLDFEKRHFELIERFGRYPKRNAALGRQSSSQEISYIAQSGDGDF